MTYRPHQFSYMLGEVPKYIPIASVNHDFIPTELGGMPKVWWVDLPMSAPVQLKLGMHVMVHVSYMTSAFIREALKGHLFQIEDIIGTRLMIIPVHQPKQFSYTTSLHKEIGQYLGNTSGYPLYRKSPFGWGVNTNYPTAPYKPDQFQIKYGTGAPMGYLEVI